MNIPLVQYNEQPDQSSQYQTGHDIEINPLTIHCGQSDRNKISSDQFYLSLNDSLIECSDTQQTCSELLESESREKRLHKNVPKEVASLTPTSEYQVKVS